MLVVIYINTVNFQTDFIKETNVHSVISVAILSPLNEDCNEIHKRAVNSLMQDDSMTYCSVDFVYYEDKSGEQLYPVEFLNSLPPSGLPSHKLNLKIITIIIFLILLQFKTLQIRNLGSKSPLL
jgi:hypothetical protein